MAVLVASKEGTCFVGCQQCRWDSRSIAQGLPLLSPRDRGSRLLLGLYLCILSVPLVVLCCRRSRSRLRYIRDKNKPQGTHCQVFLLHQSNHLLDSSFQSILIVALCGSRVSVVISRKNKVSYIYFILTRIRSYRFIFIACEIKFVLCIINFYFLFEFLFIAFGPFQV